MAQLDAIWKRAESDLVVSTETGDADTFLWEHSARVARSALRIARVPSVAQLSPDAAALTAAGLYHDAAWAVRVRAGEIDRREILIRPPPEDHHERSAEILTTSLRSLMASASLERAERAVILLERRDTESVEARIVADADALEDFGLVSLWAAIRRGALEGHAVHTLLERWRRRKEYDFWSALLHDSFHFPAAREWAKARLGRSERLMSELEREQNANDLEDR